MFVHLALFLLFRVCDLSILKDSSLSLHAGKLSLLIHEVYSNTEMKDLNHLNYSGQFFHRFSQKMLIKLMAF